MSKRPVHLLIEDIWEAIEKIERFTGESTAEAFAGDDKTSDAVARNLEIIGEAAARLPQDFRDAQPRFKTEYLEVPFIVF